MSQLLIDVGNTAIHWAVKEPGEDLGPMQSCAYRDEQIDRLLTYHWSAMTSIKKVIICSVAGTEVNASIRRWLLNYWNLTPSFITAPVSGYGIQNGYAEPSQLGADRWAAMVGAFQLGYGASCILDCGTAVTFDVVESNGQHLGGWIMPGYQVFRQSLSQKTDGIDMVDESSTRLSSFGCTTRECVDIGWHQSIVSLIEKNLSDLGGREFKCFITGGDAHRLLPLLGSEWCYANDLVLQGLAIMASRD